MSDSTKPIDLKTLRLPCASGEPGDSARLMVRDDGELCLAVEQNLRENWFLFSPDTADLLGDALKQWAREARMR